MTRIAKLYAAVIGNRRSPIPFRDFEKLLAAFGFEHVRTNGSHRQYAHRSVDHILSVQPRGHEAKPYQVEQFLDIIEEYGLTIEP